MSYEQFLERVMQRAGFEQTEQADKAARATLQTLAERLTKDEKHSLSAELPEPLAQILRTSAHEGDFDLAEFYERVQRREGGTIHFAVEHTQAVCEALAGVLSEPVLVRLRKHLPEPMAELFAERPIPPPPPRPIHARAEPSTRLSEAKPGSRHPLSEGRYEPAHTHSVARSEDPHADTKLSSSRGLTQERFEETLAEGQPLPAKPISEG